jgi:uncharacterized caspase-like protein
MTTRRRFIQALAAAPAAATLGARAQASPDPARIALAIGNNAYRDSPLLNPVNDARAMGELLGKAGFSVDTQLDCDRGKLAEAVERFTAAAQKPGVRQVLFYYAGHGLQLEWRNYLVPVDSSVESASQVASRCFNLATILRHLGRAKDRTFIIILDACRNDPFGRGYRPEQKGLSQFDAPPGSLLAYSTAPGGVAEDGEGMNGLYTSHLVRELAVRGAKLEDALKRVRLNVRLASRGSQVPWETTSLESDVYVFEDGRRKLSEEELEAEAEADIAMWSTVKASRKPEDMVGYLRKFPNGRFAEMAQVRLSRFASSGDARVASAVPVATPAPGIPPAADGKAAEAPRIANEAQWAALPAGTLYYDPKGNLRRKS